jgi:hypothetical protein
VRVESRGFSQAPGGLFSAMKTGGFFGADRIPWFDGNLFADPEVLPLEGPDIEVVRTAQRGLVQHRAIHLRHPVRARPGPAKRSQLGAHSTDPGSIMRLIRPVVEEPLVLHEQIHAPHRNGDVLMTLGLTAWWAGCCSPRC